MDSEWGCRGGCTFVEKARLAMTSGAVALIIFFYGDSIEFGAGGADCEDIAIPVLGVRAPEDYFETRGWRYDYTNKCIHDEQGVIDFNEHVADWR